MLLTVIFSLSLSLVRIQVFFSSFLLLFLFLSLPPTSSMSGERYTHSFGDQSDRKGKEETSYYHFSLSFYLLLFLFLSGEGKKEKKKKVFPLFLRHQFVPSSSSDSSIESILLSFHFTCPFHSFFLFFLLSL